MVKIDPIPIRTNIIVIKKDKNFRPIANGIKDSGAIQ